jgi:hypothetical protein
MSDAFPVSLGTEFEDELRHSGSFKAICLNSSTYLEQTSVRFAFLLSGNKKPKLANLKIVGKSTQTFRSLYLP